MSKKSILFLVIVLILSSCASSSVPLKATNDNAKKDFITRLKRLDTPNKENLIGRLYNAEWTTEDGETDSSSYQVAYDVSNQFGVVTFEGAYYLYDNNRDFFYYDPQTKYIEKTNPFYEYLDERTVSDELLSYLKTLDNSKFYYDNGELHFKLENVGEISAFMTMQSSEDESLWEESENLQQTSLETYYGERGYYSELYFDGFRLVWESPQGATNSIAPANLDNMPVTAHDYIEVVGTLTD